MQGLAPPTALLGLGRREGWLPQKIEGLGGGTETSMKGTLSVFQVFQGQEDGKARVCRPSCSARPARVKHDLQSAHDEAREEENRWGSRA